MSKNTSIKTASAYMWSKKVRTFPDYFANYEQLHRYRLEAAQAEEEKKNYY